MALAVLKRLGDKDYERPRPDAMTDDGWVPAGPGRTKNSPRRYEAPS